MKRMSAYVTVVPVQTSRRSPATRMPDATPVREERRLPDAHEEALRASIDLSLSCAGEEIDELFPLKQR